jgi:N-acetyl-gamma-glutamyl-phosphate reductase
MELTRILEGHPHMTLVQATSRKEAGQRLHSLYPFLQDMPTGDVVLTEPDPDALAAACDVVFLAIPHGAAMEMGARLLEKGCRVVDLSADYRLRDKAVYEQWYKVEHTRPNVLAKAVYGLPELYAEQIAGAGLIANPGCYPTASILALYPALRHGLVETDDIVIDAKSGTTGAGRGANVTSLFSEVYDTFRAYGLTTHRHTPEIEQELGCIAGGPLVVSFNPHLLPVNRGILATIYTRLAPHVTLNEKTLADIRALYDEAYAPHFFVRMLPTGKLPELRNVRGSMFCDIALALDVRTRRLIIVSVIDNLCRGASGQAVANANLMCGLPLDAGLRFTPLVP